MKSTVYIVVPNWNGADFLKECLDSLLVQTQECHVVVVENGSVDESDKILAKYGNKITALKQPINLGFAGGVNVGINYAIKNSADFVLLFNNDAVADKNLVKELLATVKKDKTTGIVTSKIKRKDNTLDSTGDFYSSRGLPFPRGRGQLDKGQFDDDLVIFGGSGGSSLYSIKMLKKIGLFDEDFFAYFEDVDISFRAQLAGWTAKYSPKAITYHKISATSSRIPGFTTYQTAKNFPVLFVKNVPSKLFIKYFLPTVYTYYRMWFAKLVKGGFGSFSKGFLNSLVLLPGAFIKRRKIQKNKVVTTEYIDSLIFKGNPKNAFGQNEPKNFLSEL